MTSTTSLTYGYCPTAALFDSMPGVYHAGVDASWQSPATTAVHPPRGQLAIATPPGVGPDTRLDNCTPTEIYGPPLAPIGCRLGNGGAGATGVLRAVCENFLQTSGTDARIAWVQNISRINLDKLRDASIDIALTYDPPDETLLVRDGCAVHYQLAFYDHFVVVGPRRNPAALRVGGAPVDAFARLASSPTAAFLSRGDGSGTHKRESLLWQLSGHPEGPAPGAYRVRCLPPTLALQEADAQQAYMLTDRASYLTVRDSLASTQVYCEADALLLNPCHVLLRPAAPAVAWRFADYLVGPRGQSCIAAFAVAGRRAFTPAAQPHFAEPECLEPVSAGLSWPDRRPGASRSDLERLALRV